MFLFVLVWVACPVPGLAGQVFSLWAEQLFGPWTRHTVNKHEQNKLWRLKNVMVKNVNWEEMCNQIPSEFSSYNNRSMTHSEHVP